MLDRMLNREIMTVLEYKRINLLNSSCEGENTLPTVSSEAFGIQNYICLAVIDRLASRRHFLKRIMRWQCHFLTSTKSSSYRP